MRQEREGLARLRSRQVDVFGIEPPAPLPVKRPPMPAEPTDRVARPFPVQHQVGCAGARVDRTRWSNGVTVSRCLDCGATSVRSP